MILFCLNEINNKFDSLEQLIKDIIKCTLFYVCFGCFENVENAVSRGNNMRTNNQDVKESEFFEKFHEVLNPEAKNLFNFYRWMI